MVLDQFSLKGKTAIVTGSSGMMGKMICETIWELGGDAVMVDLTLGNDITVFSYCMRYAGMPIDILINNAVGNQKPVESPFENYNQDLEVGLTGAANMIQVCSDQLRKRKGVILNMGSDLSLIGPDQTLYPNGLKKPLSYSVVKHGIIGMTRYFATLFAPDVRTNCVCFGGVDVGQKFPENLPMKRLAKLEELKGTIAYMVSDASSYMNGSIVSVDGGRTCI